VCALALCAAGACGSPPPPQIVPPHDDAPPAPPASANADDDDAPRRASAPPPLDPPIGFLDEPATDPNDAVPTQIASESPPVAARFKGQLVFRMEQIGAFAPGQTRVLPFALVRRGDEKNVAGLRAIRAAGFEGVKVGVVKRFSLYEDVLSQLGNVALDFLLGAGKKKETAPTQPTDVFSLDLPNERAGLGKLSVTVPASAAPGRYKGRIEIEGNFDTRSFPIELEVVRYEDRIGALLAGLDDPEPKLALTKLVAAQSTRDGHKEARVALDTVVDGDPLPSTLWNRWLLAGTGIWDLGAVQWAGPILRSFPHERALTGPRDAPRIFVLNGRSVDIVSVRERRTIERLPLPNGPAFQEHMQVSSDGERVLAGCGKDLCFFSHENGAWKHTVLTDVCSTSDAPCAFVETDGDMREMVAGVGASTWGWDTLVRYDLVKNERSSVAMGSLCSRTEHLADFPRGRFVAASVVHTFSLDDTVGVAVVHFGDRSIERIAFQTQSHVHEISLDEASNDVVVDTSASMKDSCMLLSSATPLAARACPPKRAKKKKPLVPGTRVTFDVTLSEIDYVR
jgi:hypothetical protein